LKMEVLEMTDDLISQFQSGAVTPEEIVIVFNPDNAATMPEAFLQFMPHLTGEQIRALAEAYPNKPTGNSYLVLMDSSKKENQLYPRSTWQNLFNLRRVGGTAAKTMVAFTFASRFQERKNISLSTSPVQDISNKEPGLPGIQVSPVQIVEPGSGANEAGKGAGAADEATGQQGTLVNGVEGAVNAIGAGSASGDFPELSIEDIQKDQKGAIGAGSEETGSSAAAGAANGATGSTVAGAAASADTAGKGTEGTGTTGAAAVSKPGTAKNQKPVSGAGK
jgi:hypothetical protein